MTDNHIYQYPAIADLYILKLRNLIRAVTVNHICADHFLRLKTSGSSSKHFCNAGLYLFLLILTALIKCSGLSVLEERDDFGRVIKKETHRRDKIASIEKISYIGNTDKPLITEYINFKEGILLTKGVISYSYSRGNVSLIRYFKFTDNARVKTGEISYKYSGSKPLMIEYYSELEKYKIRLQHGLDLYYYNKDDLINRRIIEYEYNPDSGQSIQVSQFVINYNNNKINSMYISMVDRNIQNLVKSKESDIKIISEIIQNIERSLKDRCKGASSYIINGKEE